MGSLTSTPKIPKQQVIYMPAPSSNISASNTSNISNSGSSSSVSTSEAKSKEPSAEEIASNERKKSLLARNRSRFGTVLTSLQGVLSEKDSNNLGRARKTLLGE